jgi:hypothetical protein
MRGFNSDELLNRTVRGTVRVMRDGNIRWSFVSVRVRDVDKQLYIELMPVFSQVSIYNRHDQWRFDRSVPCEYLLYLITPSSSEGVQIGGVCSAAGVVGAWSGAHHEQG